MLYCTKYNMYSFINSPALSYFEECSKRLYFDFFDVSIAISENKVTKLRFSHYVKSVPPYNNAHVCRFPEGFLCIAQHNLLMLEHSSWILYIVISSMLSSYWLDLWKLHSTVRRTNNLYVKRWLITECNLFSQDSHKNTNFNRKIKMFNPM